MPMVCLNQGKLIVQRHFAPDWIITSSRRSTRGAAGRRQQSSYLIAVQIPSISPLRRARAELNCGKAMEPFQARRWSKISLVGQVAVLHLIWSRW